MSNGRNVRIAPGARIQIGGRTLNVPPAPDLADYTPITLTFTGTIEMEPGAHAKVAEMLRRAYRERLVREASALGYRLFFAGVAAWDACNMSRFERIRAIELKAFARLARRCRAAY